ncbi:MAG: winged helix-turn-helix transcriptional regulator [Promethearchaeota archaeon]
MDSLDFFLMKKLMENCRLTFRELAEMTDLSVSAVHKRIKKLEDDNIINAYIARPSIIALKCLWVTVFGISKVKSMDLVSKVLGQHENITFVGIGGQKSLYIYAILRDISELQELSIYVTKTAQISKPFVGIVNAPYTTTPEPLTSIDYKILKTLNKDSRKPITDIADDVGVSAKTVKKKLDRMIKNNLATFSIQWKPLYGVSYLTYFSISLNEGSNIDSTIRYLYEKYNQNIVNCINYSNIPNIITLEIWTRTAQESQKIQEQLQTEGFKDIVPYIALSGEYYDCWMDQLLRTK